jgi:tetratricopeptide (TPR) repeat protein
MGSSLTEHIACLADKPVDDAWLYMQKLCDKASVLLLIDDKREKKQPYTQEEDETFKKLFNLRATVLFASRTLIDGNYFKEKPVGFLSTDDCIQIFQTQRYLEKIFNIPPLSKEDTSCIVGIIEDRAGCNTLVVTRLGRMANDYSWSIAKLAEKLEEQKFVIDKGLNNETLQMEINKLYRFESIENDDETSLLEAFALFPDVPLDQDTCIKWLHRDAKISEARCNLLLTKLAKSTWLMLHDLRNECTESICSYSMHQLVKAVVTTQTTISFDNHRNLVEQMVVAVSWSQKETFQKAQQYISYATSLAEYFSEKHVDGADLAHLMLWLGRYYGDIADYSKALEWYFKALTIRERVLGKDHPDTATTYNNIAGVYFDLGEYEKALEWNFKALAIRESVLGKDHPDTAASYNNIALVYADLGEYEKALEWNFKDLAIMESVLGKDHPSTATTYNNIAKVYHKLGKYLEALEWYKKALIICEKVFGKEHQYTISIFNSISLVYQSMG